LFLGQNFPILQQDNLNYYKLLSSVGSNLQPYKSQSYIVVIDDNISIKNKDGKVKIYTSKNIREALGSQRFTKEQKEKWFKEFFGWFDLGLFELLKNKYAIAHQSDVFEKPETTEIPPENIKEVLSKEIIKILNEFMDSPPSIATDTEPGDTGLSIDDMKSDAEKQKEDAEKRKDLVQQKKQTEDEKKMHYRQAQRDRSSFYNYDKYTKKQDDQKLASINKMLTKTS
jgi:hypothetical protein